MFGSGKINRKLDALTTQVTALRGAVNRIENPPKPDVEPEIPKLNRYTINTFSSENVVHAHLMEDDGKFTTFWEITGHSRVRTDYLQCEQPRWVARKRLVFKINTMDVKYIAAEPTT